MNGLMNEEQIVAEIKEWLGEDGLTFFKENLENYGTVSPVLKDGPIPHIVHFREGMYVRNKLRDLTDNSWTAHEYDDRWQGIVEMAIQ